MELGYHNIIKGVILTPKSDELFKKLGKITFKVDRKANKIMVREAVEKIWDVKVDNVRMVTTPGKRRIIARRVHQAARKKKAIVTLKKGYKIELPGQFEMMGAAPTEVESVQVEGK